MKLLAALVSVALCGLASPAHCEPVLTLAFGGDVYIDSPTRQGVERLAPAVGGLDEAYRELLGALSPALERADLSILNLETPIASRLRERRPGEPPIFAAPPELLDALTWAGVDAVTIANNHALDQGFRGLGQTLTSARQRGLAVVGAAPTASEAAGPLALQTEAGVVALCSWTQSLNVRAHDEPEGEPEGPPLAVSLIRDDTIASCLRAAREASALAVAVFHWTPSDWRGPRDEERGLVQAAVDAGADLVIGHGPHVPGPASWVSATGGARRALVIYSLGNLVGAMGEESEQWRSTRAGVRDAPVLLISTRREGRRLIPASYEVVPFWIADPSPRSPGWPEGQPLARPLSISRELERLAQAHCGAPCSRIARGYRRRLSRLRAALSLEPAPESPLPGQPSAPTPGEVASSSPPPEARLAPLLEGISLPIHFRVNQVEPSVTDAEALEGIVALLDEHRGFAIHLRGSSVAGEDLMPPRQMGARRARAVMWLLSGLGPSRSRFIVEGGPAAEEAEVVLRLGAAP